MEGRAHADGRDEPARGRARARSAAISRSSSPRTSSTAATVRSRPRARSRCSFPDCSADRIARASAWRRPRRDRGGWRRPRGSRSLARSARRRRRHLGERTLGTPRLLGRDMAVDLGTANTLVYVRGRGVVLDEPSVVAVNARDGRPLAVGIEAKRMIGRTPGHIQRDPSAEGRRHRRLRHLREDAPLLHPARAPAQVGEAAHGDLRAVGHHRRRAARGAGGRRARRRAQAGVHHRGADGRRDRRRASRCTSPPGNMIVDIGGGTTEVAVISLGGIVASESIRIAGDELDEAIINYVKKEYSLALGERTSEEIKIALGERVPAAGRAVRGGARSRPRHRSAEDDRRVDRGDPRGDRGAGRRDRRRGEGDARQDAARARGRHHGEAASS